MKQSLSVVLSVHNEESVLDDALKSVKEIADEIIIVNNESTDNSVKVAKKYTKNILEHKNNPLILNQAKNYGFSKTKSDWVFSLDPDERVSPELAKEITAIVSSGSLRNSHLLTEVSYPSVNGYWIPRKNFVFNKWLEHGIWYPDYQLRLFRREKGKFPAVHNHEFLSVKGKTEKLKGHLIHKSYSSITEYIDKFNYTYTDNEAETFIKSGKKIVWIDAVRWPLSDFLTNFFARKSYKDGLHGLVLSMLQAFYALEVFTKIWERQGFWEYDSKNLAKDVKREFHAKSKEFSWWYAKELIPWFLKPKQVIKKLINTSTH